MGSRVYLVRTETSIGNMVKISKQSLAVICLHISIPSIYCHIFLDCKDNNSKSKPLRDFGSSEKMSSFNCPFEKLLNFSISNNISGQITELLISLNYEPIDNITLPNELTQAFPNLEKLTV